MLREWVSGEQKYRAVEDSELLVAKMPWLRIVIFDSPNPSPRWIINGAEWSLDNIRDSTTTMYLLYDNPRQHFHLIRFPSVFFRTSSTQDKKAFCNGCFARYNLPCKTSSSASKTITNHVCAIQKCNICGVCFDTASQLKDHSRGFKIRCEKCLLECNGKTCLYEHSIRCLRETVGQLECRVCSKLYVPKTFQNGFRDTSKCPNCLFCGTCFRMYPAAEKNRHTCFWPMLKMKEEDDKEKYWVFDFESMFMPGVPVHSKLANGTVQTYQTKKHVVNLAILRQLYTGVEEVYKTMDEFVCALKVKGMCLHYDLI